MRHLISWGLLLTCLMSCPFAFAQGTVENDVLIVFNQPVYFYPPNLGAKTPLTVHDAVAKIDPGMTLSLVRDTDGNFTGEYTLAGKVHTNGSSVDLRLSFDVYMSTESKNAMDLVESEGDGIDPDKSSGSTLPTKVTQWETISLSVDPIILKRDSGVEIGNNVRRFEVNTIANQNSSPGKFVLAPMTSMALKAKSKSGSWKVVPTHSEVYVGVDHSLQIGPDLPNASRSDLRIIRRLKARTIP